MITLKKERGRDFIVLNLTDLHDQQPKKRDIMIGTITKLVERVKPDLITISGDFTEAGREEAEKNYEAITTFIDSFQIPWAPIWGNHDIGDMAERHVAHKYCLYEKGNPAFGCGNYVISIEENGKPVEAIFMLDSHRSRLYPEQISWYHDEVQELKRRGCNDTMMILHIPIYAYKQAFEEAFSGNWVKKNATYEMFQEEGCWTEKYKDTIGIQLEDVACCNKDDGVLDAVLESGSTKTIIAGHDHINNWMINYKGVRLVYALKTGAGAYWESRLNGGTVIKVNSKGVSEVYHEYVEVREVREKCALFFDIDATVLSEKTGTAPESALRALERAKKNGHLLFINTERTWCDVPEVIKNAPFDGFICDCGTYILYHGEVIYESSINRKGCNKVTAIDFVLKKSGVPLERCYVFGGNSNNLVMFEYSPHAIAMGKHAPSLEPYAEYITTDVEEDGLGKALYEYAFI